MSTHWFFGLGIRAAKLLKRPGLVAFEIAVGVDVGATKLFEEWGYTYERWWTLTTAALVIVALYVMRSHAENELVEKERLAAEKKLADDAELLRQTQAAAAKDAAEKETAERHEREKQRELQRLRKFKSAVAGNLSALLKGFVENNTELSELRTAFLSHAIDVVTDYLGLPRGDDRLTATWTVPCDHYTMWRVVAYDRRQATRQPGHKREIAKGIPGAAQAYLTGEMVFIEDTLAEGVRDHFVDDPPYRSILSVPARIMCVDGRHNVVIDDVKDAIVGVLNVDCKETGVLTPELVGMLYETAYMLGLLDQLGGVDVWT